MPEETHPPSRRIASTSNREIFLAVLGALVVLGLVGYAVISMGNNSVQTSINGKIIEKKLVPRPERQITIGAGGVKSADKAGLYYLSVRANETGEVYNVLIDSESYDRLQVGDRYQIPKASLVTPP